MQVNAEEIIMKVAKLRLENIELKKQVKRLTNIIAKLEADQILKKATVKSIDGVKLVVAEFKEETK